MAAITLGIGPHSSSICCVLVVQQAVRQIHKVRNSSAEKPNVVQQIHNKFAARVCIVEKASQQQVVDHKITTAKVNKVVQMWFAVAVAYATVVFNGSIGYRCGLCL